MSQYLSCECTQVQSQVQSQRLTLRQRQAQGLCQYPSLRLLKVCPHCGFNNDVGGNSHPVMSGGHIVDDLVNYCNSCGGDIFADIHEGQYYEEEELCLS